MGRRASVAVVVLVVLCSLAGAAKSRYDSAKVEAAKAAQEATQSRMALQTPSHLAVMTPVAKPVVDIELVSMSRSASDGVATVDAVVKPARAAKKPRAHVGEAKTRRVTGQHPLSVKRCREIRVTLGTQELVAREDGQEVYWFRCSTSVTGLISPPDIHPETPHDHLGSFKVMDKTRLRHSTQYDVDMPWAIHYHGGHFIHATLEVAWLGQPASHGCVRLSPADARTLYDWTHVGDSVVVER